MINILGVTVQTEFLKLQLLIVHIYDEVLLIGQKLIVETQELIYLFGDDDDEVPDVAMIQFLVY